MNAPQHEIITMAKDEDAKVAMADATDGNAAVVYVKVAPDAILFCTGPRKTVATFGGFCSEGERALDAALRELEEESCGAIKETRDGAMRRMRYAFHKSIGPTYVFVLDYSDEPEGFAERTRQDMLARHERLAQDPVADKDRLEYEDLIVVTYDQIREALGQWHSHEVPVRPDLKLPFRPVLKSMLEKIIELEGSRPSASPAGQPC
jgi:hypothetical protein